MTTLGILNWQNETGLTNYPLSSDLISTTKKKFPKNFIVDANFVQFDTFIPQLTRLEVTAEAIELTLLVDSGAYTASLTPAAFAASPIVTLTQGGRYLGKLVFGDDTTGVFDSFKGEVITTSQLFLASTVRSIPSTAGVFSLDGYYGAVEIASTDTLFFFVNGNVVTGNAVYIPTAATQPYLKMINRRHPVDNNLLLLGSDTVTINPLGQNALSVDLIKTDVPNILPSTI